MLQRKYITLMSLIALITISGCSLIGTKQVEIVSKPLEIDIIQPTLPRPIEMTSPNWYVVSEAKKDNLCVATLSYDPKRFEEKDGVQVEKLKRPKTCNLEDRDNPEWPVDYSHLDYFLDEMKEQNGGEVVFVATTIGDYQVMSANMQELKRYIKQLGEVVVYYRDVTIKTPKGNEKGVAVQIEKKND